MFRKWLIYTYTWVYQQYGGKTARWPITEQLVDWEPCDIYDGGAIDMHPDNFLWLNKTD